MGMDGVELVIEVEESFEIKIPDEEASKMYTAVELYAFVLRALDQKGLVRGHGCLTQTAFYKMRRSLIGVFNAERRDVRPKSPLGKFIPERSRRKAWFHLEKELGLRLPALCRPTWLVALLTTSWVALWGVWIALALYEKSTLIFAASFPGQLVLAMLLQMVTDPLAYRIPKSCTTVGEASHALVTDNFGAIALLQSGYLPQEVWTTLKEIICEQLGVSPDKVVPEARFIQDLKMD